MVLQVLADTGQVVHHVDAERLERLGVADARELEQLRRVDRTAAEDDLVRARLLERVLAGAVLDADGARALEEHPRDLRARLQLEVRALDHGMEVGPRRAQPPAAPDVAVEGREALLSVAVDVGGEFVAGLLGRLEEGLEKRVRGRAALELQRPVAAAILVGAGQARLHLLEVRQAVRVVPRLHAGVVRPALDVERIAALEDHPVDRARAAQHLAARVVDLAAVHVRLGLGLVLPVVEAAADRPGQRGRHVDEDVPLRVHPAGLEDEHAVRRIRSQPVGERTPGRSAPDDDEVVRRDCHGPSGFGVSQPRALPKRATRACPATRSG